MSSLLFATPKELTGWLAKLASGYRVLAPRQEGPSVVYRPQTAEQLASADIDALLRRATASPKQAMLPQCETLVTFKSVKDAEDPSKLTTTLENPCQAEPTVLFGCRPCDARGFVVLDRPYLEGKFKDPYYGARREATVIVTQACPSAFASCFCNWVGSHPSDKEGSDILFTAVEGGFVLEVVTDKGQALVEGAGFADAADKVADVEAAHAAAAASLAPAPELTHVMEKVASRFTDTEFWEKETVKCLSCGACTYLCPTCQCFTITDEGSQLDGRRLRSWDSCMTPLFTLETSGHNPRPSKADRMRNRVSHKFSFYPERYDGFFSCVGCGRCVVSCPVSLDIRHMVKAAVEGSSLTFDDAAPAESPAVEAVPAPEAPAPAEVAAPEAPAVAEPAPEAVAEPEQAAAPKAQKPAPKAAPRASSKSKAKKR
ncbi:4Fe-4S dicluster domain-containing protein [Mailhella sp.]|uniref:4Fe-4S dicluster domain-containing protein n=1 Tax=Mailhella sp. TaxID=1981029 RepID=UPI003AB7A4E9